MELSKYFRSHLFILILSVIIFQEAKTEKVSTYRSGSVYCKNKQCQFSKKLDWKLASAVGTFNDSLLSTGWGILDVSAGHATNATNSNTDIMFAAGYLEGVFTAHHMEAHYTNLRTVLLPKSKVKLANKLKQWFVKQREWSDMMVTKHAADSPLWRHVGYILAQLDGLNAGYKSVRNGTDAPLDTFAFDFLNAAGDLGDLLLVIDPSSIPDFDSFTAEEATRYMSTHGHCSALIKVTPGFENIFMSHSTWFDYRATNRIFKHYNFNVNDASTAAKKLSFSSYPGFLESVDDFYILGSGMVMLQTSINVYDETLYNQVTPDSLLAWQRVRVANMMAHSGKEWTGIIAKYNSGTYNNEYMVIDLKKFTPLAPLPDDTLWVANQIPGLVVAGDITALLRDGYFPSYNVPFFEEIFNKSGQLAFMKTHGTDFSWDLAPRAKIFRRDQGKVSDMESMKKIMRYNDFKHDKYSGGSPMGAICARGDLTTKGVPSPDGCTDTKVTDVTMAKAFQANIINGPTLGTNLPPFSWTGPFAKKSHVGLPSTYQFKFEQTQPRFP